MSYYTLLFRQRTHTFAFGTGTLWGTCRVACASSFHACARVLVRLCHSDTLVSDLDHSWRLYAMLEALPMIVVLPSASVVTT